MHHSWPWSNRKHLEGPIRGRIKDGPTRMDRKLKKSTNKEEKKNLELYTWREKGDIKELAAHQLRNDEVQKADIPASSSSSRIKWDNTVQKPGERMSVLQDPTVLNHLRQVKKTMRWRWYPVEMKNPAHQRDSAWSSQAGTKSWEHSERKQRKAATGSSYREEILAESQHSNENGCRTWQGIHPSVLLA